MRRRGPGAQPDELLPTWGEAARELRGHPAKLALGGAWASVTAFALVGVTWALPALALVLFVSWTLYLLMGMRYEAGSRRKRERYMSEEVARGELPEVSFWARLRSATPRALMAFGVTLGFGMITGWLAGAITQDVMVGVTAGMVLVGLSALASALLLAGDVLGANPQTERVAAEEEALRVVPGANGDLAGGLALSAPQEGGELSVRAASGGLESSSEVSQGEVVFGFEEEGAEQPAVAPARHEREIH